MQIDALDTQNLVPSHFMTVYSRNDRDPYLEIGEFILVDGKYKVGPSVPADLEFLNGLARTIKQENFQALKFKGLTPQNVIFHHSENNEPSIMWVMEPCKKQIYFSSSMGIASGIYEFPRTLFTCNRGGLDCYRLKEKDKINLDMKAYVMPLPNIGHHGDVCLGNSKSKLAKPKTMEEYIEQMENLFFQTTFNVWHHDYFTKDKQYKAMKDLMKKRDLKLFPLIEPKNKQTLKTLRNALS